MDLQNKNILVTGAGGSGIGFGIAKVLSKFGATVIINEKNFDKAEQAAKKIPNSMPIAADICKSDEVKAMFDKLSEKVGVLHGLVNNAGLGLSKLAHEASEIEFDRLYNLDVKAVWQLSKRFANQLMGHKESGGIVNVSSIHAMATIPKYGIYASAKSAVNGLTRGMSVELGLNNIRVNAIAPGYVHAEQNYELIKTFTEDPRKWVDIHTKDYQSLPFQITAEDCGNVVGFLLSDLSQAVTGQIITVDNGTKNLLYANSFINRER